MMHENVRWETRIRELGGQDYQVKINNKRNHQQSNQMNMATKHQEQWVINTLVGLEIYQA